MSLMYSRSRIACVNGVTAPMSATVRADRQQVAREPSELGRAITRRPAAARTPDAGEGLARHRPALVALHRRHVVDAVGVRHEAVVADLSAIFSIERCR